MTTFETKSTFNECNTLRKFVNKFSGKTTKGKLYRFVFESENKFIPFLTFHLLKSSWQRSKMNWGVPVLGLGRFF
jgi:hypothetical protein